MAFAFTLSKKLNEASIGYVPSNIPAWNFAGDSQAAVTAEMNNEIMSEAAAYREFVVNTDEMLAETVLSNPERFQALHEGVFSTIKEKVVNFFKKLIAMVKGVIEKLKASFYKMTNQTTKWVGIMRPKINAASGQPGMADVTYEMHEYKPEYITKTLPGKLDGLQDAWKADAKITELNKGAVADHMKKVKSGHEYMAAATAGEKYDDNVKDGQTKTNRERLDNLINPLNHERDIWKTALEDFNKDFPGKIGNLLGASGSSMDAVEADVIKQARGAEKKEQKIGSNAGNMLKVVESSKDTINTLKTTYENHVKFLEQVKSELEKAGTDFDPKPADKNATIPGEVMTAAREAYTARYNHLMQVTQAYETQMGKVRQLNITLVTQMASEYMSALTKFASFKGKKD